jgi:hypothetical protein
MATYSAAMSVHKTLTANTVDVVTLTEPAWTSIEVVNRSEIAELYYTVNGSTPTPGTDDTFLVMPYSADTVPDVSVATQSTVKVVSTGAVAYSVIGHGAY